MYKAGGAVLGSTIIVMAWTGVYLSRHPRAVEEDTGLQNDTNSLYYYESDTNDVNMTVDIDIAKRDKIKEVCKKRVFSKTT